jgi:hypothetical protein
MNKTLSRRDENRGGFVFKSQFTFHKSARLSRMKHRTPLALVLALSIVSSLSAQSIWKEPKNATWKNATGAEQYSRLLWQAVEKKDWLGVESHIASNFVYLDRSGTKDKSQWVSDVKQASQSASDITDINVTASGIDAIVTYTRAGSRYMSVWQQERAGGY